MRHSHDFQLLPHNFPVTSWLNTRIGDFWGRCDVRDRDLAVGDVCVDGIEVDLEKGRPMKIYLAASGEYSDYHIDGAFSTKEKADNCAKKNHGFVETFPLDERMEWICRNAWQTSMYISDGRIDKSFTHQNEWNVFAPPAIKIRSIQHECDFKGFDCLTVSSYVSQTHSIKIAVELRQKILRERLTDPKYVLPAVIPND